MRIKFDCPACGHNQLEEIMVDVTQASIVHDVEPDCADYGEITSDGGVIDRFQCVSCGNYIVDELKSAITTYEELYNWLEKERMLISE